MRLNRSETVEGELLSYLLLDSEGEQELPPEEMMTFPYLTYPHLCDGCMLCVEECPVSALELQSNHEAIGGMEGCGLNLPVVLTT